MADKAQRPIDVRKTGSLTWIRFRCSKLLEDDVIAEVADELFKLADADEPMLAIDFRGVDFMSSAMLGKLISLQQRVRAMNGSLRLCRIHPDVFQIFRAANLDRYFMVSDEFDRVVAAEENQQPPVAADAVGAESSSCSATAVDAREILNQLAEVLHCAEYLQKQLSELTETFLALHDCSFEQSNRREKPARPASPDETAEHTAWKPPKS